MYPFLHWYSIQETAKLESALKTAKLNTVKWVQGDTSHPESDQVLKLLFPVPQISFHIFKYSQLYKKEQIGWATI